jgi:hypothetical protein
MAFDPKEKQEKRERKGDGSSKQARAETAESSSFVLGCVCCRKRKPGVKRKNGLELALQWKKGRP